MPLNHLVFMLCFIVFFWLGFFAKQLLSKRKQKFDGFLEVIEQEHEPPTFLLHINQKAYDDLSSKQYVVLSVVKKRL